MLAQGVEGHSLGTEGWPAAVKKRRGQAHGQTGGAPGGERALGIVAEFSLFLAFLRFYVLNTNGKEEFNQLECWAETNKMKWSRDKCKVLYFI